MRIAFFHELHQGGARRGTNEFALQLKMQGHIVDLYYAGVKNDLSEKKFYSDIHFYKFTPKSWTGNNWKAKLYKDTVELLKVCMLDRQIAQEINKKNYDLAYIAASDYIESPFILNFLKMPKFFYCNDPYFRIIYEPDLFNKTGVSKPKIYYEYLIRFIKKYIDKWNISKADYIISISNYAKKAFYSAYKRWGHIIYYGVDISYFVPKNVRRDIDLLYIGSYDFLDGYPLFREVLEQLKLKVKVREVLFENEWLDDDEVRDLYRRSKILVAPSFREPLGLVPLEAMSCGCVVVAVDDGAHKETVVNGKAGFVVKNDSKKMSQKIEWLLNHPSKLKQMSNYAHIYVKNNWAWDKKGKELESYLLKHYNIKK